jgi:hypothetical protein
MLAVGEIMENRNRTRLMPITNNLFPVLLLLQNKKGMPQPPQQQKET